MIAVRDAHGWREDEEEAEEEEAAYHHQTPAIKKARSTLKRNHPQINPACQTCPQALCKSGEATRLKARPRKKLKGHEKRKPRSHPNAPGNPKVRRKR